MINKWRSRLRSVVLCSLFSFSALAVENVAKELEAAQQALQAGDYDSAYTQLLHHAESNDNPLAQFSLGLTHQMGWGRQPDPKRACQWYEQAALGDIPVAQHLLADCFLQGTHQDIDTAKAAHWYKKAAENGHLASLCDVGELYIAGKGVAQDAKRGVQLCEQAANKGIVKAQIRLGLMLLEGPEAIRDPQAAFSWIEAAAQAGTTQAQYYMGLMLSNADASNEQLALALYWFESAAAQGHVPAYLPTAQLYFYAPPDPATGQLRAKDLGKAYLWNSAALQAGEYSQGLTLAKQMQEEILRIMPTSWRTDLDEKIKSHLAQFVSASSL